MNYLLAFVLSFFILIDLSSADRNLIIIRDGEATNSIENVYNSNPSHPSYRPANLTNNGRQTVIRTAKELMVKGFNNNNITAVISSPLPRAAQTAQTLTQQGLVSRNKITYDDLLTEQQAGDLEGKSVTPWNPEFARNFHAESLEQVQQRAQDFYDAILKKYPKGNIVVVTHNSVAQDLLDLAANQRLAISPGHAKVVALPPSKEQ